MSKESYMRGFCKAAEEHGVDPVQLAKCASSPDAGIGSLEDNFGRHEMVEADNGQSWHVENISKPHVGSYLSALRRNAPWEGFVASRYRFSPSDHIGSADNGTITQSALEKARQEMASAWAGNLFPRGTGPYEAIRANLIRAGERNADAYKRTGTVEPRTVPDKSGIEDIQIPYSIFEGVSPDKQQLIEARGVKNWDDWIRVLQNTMVRKGVPRTGNIA